jgi:mono/diheme cytochrome c family protein
MSNGRRTSPAWICSLVVGLTASMATAGETASPERGYEVLRQRCFLPPDFDDAVFAELWTVWPEPERSQAETASPADRRRLTFSYYGLMPDPADSTETKPALGYVARNDGQWVMTCLACHAGKVAGRVIPGLSNSHLALQTLTEDVRSIKLKQKKPLAHLDLASISLPLSQTNGTTNSVIFGVVLGTYRRPDMSVDLKRILPPLTHHDLDPPPYWNVRKKTSLYIDGFAPKTHRPLMQFMLLPKNNRETIYGWEDDFRAIQAWIEAVPVPKYPGPIDAPVADRGRTVFEANCARCHGTYGPNGRYEQQTISIAEVGTDPVRLDALTVEHRRWMQAGWMSRYGEDPVVLDPGGYVAPPLDGVWASGPYFHNGSVPTLWHVLHPDERPAVWKRTEDGYDHARVGLEVESFDAVPESATHPAHRRRYFDTKLTGKSATGHDFPNALTDDERRAVLEYLKTL